MASNKITETLKHMQELKKQLDERLAKADTNPKETAAELGIDIDKIKTMDLNQMKEFLADGKLESLQKMADSLLDLENSKSKGVENVLDKIEKHGFDDNKDPELLNKVMGSYIIDNQKKMAENCFHFDQSDCKGGIISAHSVQKQGPLNRIAELADNKQLRVIHFKRETSGKWEANPIAISEASTFRGFCHNHDGIFSAIEQEPYTGSDFQNFLHSYRSFAYSYHMKIEKYAYFKNVINNASVSDDLLEESIGLLKMFGINEKQIPKNPNKKIEISEEQEDVLKSERFESYKIKLNQQLECGNYDQLEYFTFELDHICPIVCASWVKIHIEIPGGFIIDNNGQIYNGYPLLLTMFHTDRNTTVVLLSRFKDDSITEIVFDQLKKLSKNELEEKLTSLIFEQIENFYLSPTFWKYLPDTEKDKIRNDINAEKEQFPAKSTFKASINIFDGVHKIQP